MIWRTLGEIVLASVICVGLIFTGANIQQYVQNRPAEVLKVQPPAPPSPVEVPPAVTSSRANTPDFRDRLSKATNPLYADFNDQGPRFICTTTAIQKVKGGYILLTARHCVVDMRFKVFFVIIDKDSDTPYIRASLLVAGGPDTDAALLQINTPLDIPVIPVGDERLISVGSKVEYFGYPMNLGKLFFEGYVSAAKIGPPAYDQPQWNGDLGITIQIGPGSSGSALVDPNQEAIVGVVTGVTVSPFGGPILGMATPAKKVRQLISEQKNGRIRLQPVDPYAQFFRRFFSPR